MLPSEAEIESIVRRVVQRLRSSSASALSDPPLVSSLVVVPTALHLSDRVITLETLRSLPESSKTLTITKHSVMTPAAKDWLKAKGIAWSRAELSAGRQSSSAVPSAGLTSSPSLPPIHVFGSEQPSSRAQWTGLSKSICPKIAKIDQPSADDSTALRECQSRIRGTSRLGILIVQSPHATCWQAARDDQLRPAVVASWSCLDNVLREVPANLFIFGGNDWTAPGLANCIRRIHRAMSILPQQVASSPNKKGIR